LTRLRHPPSPGHRTGRRRLLGWASASTLLLLAACQTAPTAPDAPTRRAAALTQLGFHRSDEGWEFDISGKLLFDTASDTLDADSQATASRIGLGLAQLGITHLRVEGHTDNVGTAAANYSLSLRRAEAVAHVLAAQGLPLAQIHVRGLGKDRPVVDNNSAEGRLQNRRVAVIVPGQ
jgi:outer membrane protein OmpA-like peptidoglycan-associated protein